MAETTPTATSGGNVRVIRTATLAMGDRIVPDAPVDVWLVWDNASRFYLSGMFYSEASADLWIADNAVDSDQWVPVRMTARKP